MGCMPIHRAIVWRPSAASIAPLIAGDPQRIATRCGVAENLLVVASVAVMLGLGALMASLAPFVSDCRDVVLPWPPMVVDRGHVPCLAPFRAGPVSPPAGEITPAALTRGSTGNQCNSSHQPATAATAEAGSGHSGATASARDLRELLIDTSIQIHAPSSAPAPRRRSPPPRPHGVD